MDTREATRNYRLNQWTEIVRECRSSGQTVAVWCAENSIKLRNYYYWLKQVRTAACEALPSLQTENNSIVPVSFPLHQVNQISPQSIDSSSPAIVVRMDAISLEIHNTASMELIENILRALHHAR
ncbi:IS66 family insertion sequence element accessory protein TnpB [Desulfosporosinus sp.]|uniref:IS66 family insertion sequence element accessory protein TnpA n=1 Tax=Desulfosporosinus sp. TaxID=157907 RepID=UPI00230D2B24|nr:IS66 family insertion sequence element accessory protein TnpB [Desulfosporosinus sp.]MDA8220762.1 IS66 family insertion sequence element accessory protein TnpB [Desulfitobacterium hafniense]